LVKAKGESILFDSLGLLCHATTKGKNMREQRQQGGVDRRTLVAAALAATSFISARGAGAGTKVSQSAVRYQKTAKDGQECDECTHFSAPRACEVVDGAISPHGWCRLWVKKAA
jgi:hypothetical protein